MTRRAKFVLALSVLAIGGLAYTVFFHGSIEGWSIDPVDTRLTRLSSNPDVVDFASWINLGGSGSLLFATIIPVGLLVVAILALMRSKDCFSEFAQIVLAFVPLVFVLGYSMVQLGWWSQFGVLALLLAIVVIQSTRSSEAIRWSSRGLVVIASLIGIGLVYPGTSEEDRTMVERAELESLIERHIAQWLARRGETESDAALAPPNVSVSLAYFGGLSVVGTPYPENVDGFSVAVRLSAASSADEAQALTTGREIRLIVHPSWDPFLEDYARLGTDQPEMSFIASLNRWLPPRWLEPVTFQLPQVPGFEGEWITIFRTIDMQDNTSAIGRLVEYFIYTGRSELAGRAQAALDGNFSNELVTQITGAELAIAMGDRARFELGVNSIVESINAGADFYLDWGFRVNMSLVLVAAKRMDVAKAQIEQCLSEASRDSVRRLSPGSLTGLLQLIDIWGIDFEDPELRVFADSLLPVES